MRISTCPFCSLPADRIVGNNTHAVWIRDAFPVAPGHSLVIPKRHMASWFDTTEAERNDLLALQEVQPDGFNIGINDGAAAGQTVPHLHIHLIPRSHGDCADPRGGVRWVLADKADYWSACTT